MAQWHNLCRVIIERNKGPDVPWGRAGQICRNGKLEREADTFIKDGVVGINMPTIFLQVFPPPTQKGRGKRFPYFHSGAASIHIHEEHAPFLISFVVERAVLTNMNKCLFTTLFTLGLPVI